MPLYSRRKLLFSTLPAIGSIASSSDTKPIALRGGFRPYVDPLTEAIVTLLTSYSVTTLLPRPQRRFITSRERTLICSSDEFGPLSPVRIDLHSGTVSLLTAVQNLMPLSLHLDVSERNLLFLAGDRLSELSLSNKRLRVLRDGVNSFDTVRDGTAAWVVRSGKLENLQGVARCSDVSSIVSVSPDGSACLAERPASDGAELWWIALIGTGGPRRLLEKAPEFCFWSADGQSILYLRENVIVRESLSKTEKETIVQTSAFGSFSPNRDNSIFVGASRSKAQPAIAIMTANGRSELALCEHHDADARTVSPVFSPDSRRVYFQSSRLGKPAIYSVNTEALVEPT